MRIDQIGFMPNLRIINITGNVNLSTLSNQLTTCDSLVDIVIDAEYILYPPNDIVKRGTADILKYLLEHNEPYEKNPLNNTNNHEQRNIKQTTAHWLDIERGKSLNTTNDKYSREQVRKKKIKFSH